MMPAVTSNSKMPTMPTSMYPKPDDTQESVYMYLMKANIASIGYSGSESSSSIQDTKSSELVVALQASAPAQG